MPQPTPNIDEIFFEALRFGTDDGVAAYLDDACDGDPQLRQRILQLVQTYPEARTFLETPAAAGIAALGELLLESPGTKIGGYTLVREIGQGGMGVVYLAEQHQPVQRQVAIKIIKPGMDTQQVIARFSSERQVLAMLDHPHIARVLDAGTTESGRPYFVMELIDGLPMTRYCDEHRLSIKQRLQLLIPVCQAVQQAHQKGIIHRDIKPSNVLVALKDGQPIPKVIDFGIAKAIGPEATDATPFTLHGQLVGTPEYMSPEQASLNPLDVDTRSDIYSLGVLLYELLSGTTPIDRGRYRTLAFDEMLRLIRTEEPLRPSKRLSGLNTLGFIAANRQTDAAKLYKQVRGELDWIALKALEKDRTRRYESASGLAADIERYLRDDPVLACPPSVVYRLRKFTRRHRVGVGAALITTTALVCGTSVATWQAIRARDAQGQAEDSQRETEVAQQQLAQRYRIAKEAVDTYLLRVTQDERLDHPSFRQLRQRLLEAALPYYDQLDQLVPSDERSRAARAEALNQLGRVQHELGRFDESRAALEEAAKLWDQLATSDPAQVAYRQSLAQALVNLAEHYRTRGDSVETLAYEQHALDLRQQLVAAHPHIDVLQLELAQSYTNVGVGAPGNEGGGLIEAAIEIWQDMVNRFPEQPLYREYLSLGYHNLAHCFAWDQAEEAIPFHELAIDLREQLAREQPVSKKAHNQWAQSHQFLADTLEKFSSRLVAAREHRDEAIRILREYAEKYPQWPETKAQLASAQVGLAHTLVELGELPLAYKAGSSALELWQQLVSEFPDMLDYEVGMAGTQHHLSSIVVALGQVDEGLALLNTARERLQATLQRTGSHDKSNELLVAVYNSLAETRKTAGLGEEDAMQQRIQKVVGEALRPSKFLTDLSNSPTQSLRVEGMVPSLSQTEEQEQSMKRLLSKLSRSESGLSYRNQRSLTLEQLENRALMAIDLSIGDATAVEGGANIRFTDAFVAPDAYGLAAARDLKIGPDGNLYVASHDTDVVKVFEYETGRFIRDLSTPGGELDGPWALAFGTDGRLYASGRYSHNVVRFDIGSGESEVFVTSDSGGLSLPWGMTFGPGGDLFVTSHVQGVNTMTDPVKRYSGTTGVFMGDFVAPGDGGLNLIAGLDFGPDGNLYVVNRSSRDVKRYDGNTGAYLNNFVLAGTNGIGEPARVLFHTDGFLYVTDNASPRVFRYNATTGQFNDILTSGVGPAANGLAFAESGELFVSMGAATLQPNSAISRFAPTRFAAFNVVLSAANTNFTNVNFETASGGAISGNDFVQKAGTVTFAPGEQRRTILITSIDDAASEPTETFNIVLSNAVGATIIDGTGIGTILDNDPFTKFYVVNDASSDRTYEYEASGAAVENYALGSGNTAPRGAASTVSGTTLWVVDANKKVYTYDTSGNSLGSWIAGGLQSTAVLEGIATNGTDVWLVDSNTDKVYRYTGAATRSSGSQNFASSFSLNSGNKNPKDIVTDGNYLWVVDDSSTDKVFKYTIAGTYVGSWKITTSGAKSPTGITLDPANVSHLWIVDRGTDRVYQYNDAAGLTSGSKSANSNWALAAGNTNPQGIADPPPPGTRTPSTALGLAPTLVSAVPGIDGSTPPLRAFEPANPRPSDPRRDVQTWRVDQALLQAGPAKLQLHYSNVSPTPPDSSEVTARSSNKDSREVFDQALLGVLAETDLSRDPTASKS